MQDPYEGGYTRTLVHPQVKKLLSTGICLKKINQSISLYECKIERGREGGGGMCFSPTEIQVQELETS